MLPWHGEHEDGANRREHAHACNNEAFALDSGCQPPRAEDGDDLNDSKGDVEQDRLERIISKRLDDEIPKGTDATASNTGIQVRTVPFS